MPSSTCLYAYYGASFKSLLLKQLGVVETLTLLCHVHKTNFLSKVRGSYSNNNNLI